MQPLSEKKKIEYFQKLKKKERSGINFWIAINITNLVGVLQKSQVTSFFGADALWSKGYTGSKVKMAIFDTGIRANHPHFRNIKVFRT